MKNILTMTPKEWSDKWHEGKKYRTHDWIIEEFLEHRITLQEMNDMLELYGNPEHREHKWLEYEMEKHMERRMIKNG